MGEMKFAYENLEVWNRAVDFAVKIIDLVDNREDMGFIQNSGIVATSPIILPGDRENFLDPCRL